MDVSTVRYNEKKHAVNMQPAQQTLRDILSIFFIKKRIFLAALTGVLITTIAVVIFAPPRYQVSADLLIKPSFTRPFMVQPSTNTYHEVGVTLKDLNTLIFLIQSTEHLAQVVARLGLASLDDPIEVQAQVNALRGRLKAEPMTESNIVRVTLSGRVPEETAQALTALIENFIDFYIEINRIKGGSNFFEDQTEFLQRRLALLSQELESVTSQEGIVDPQVQRANLLELGRNLEQERMRILAQFDATRSKAAVFEEALRRFNEDGGQPLVGLPKSATFDFPALVEMERTLAQLTINLQRARNDFQPGTKPVRDAQTQLTNMRQQIRQHLIQIIEDIDVEEKGLTATLLSLEARIASVQKEAVRLTGRALGVEQIQLERDIVSRQYMLYADKQEEERIREAKDEARFANVSVAAAPRIPPGPVFPRPGLMFLLAILIGPLVAAGLAMAAYLSEQRIYIPNDAVGIVPVLGVFDDKPMSPYIGSSFSSSRTES